MRQQYKLVEAQSPDELSRAVQALLDDGWQLWMGHQVVTDMGGSYWYSQALVRLGDAAGVSASSGMVPVRLGHSPVWTMADQ